MQKITDKEMFLALVQSPLATPLGVRQSALGGGSIEVNMPGLMKAARAIAADWNAQEVEIQRESLERAVKEARAESDRFFSR